ncbi:threonine--tRNA ligase [Candidatus Falkowbacteria bacterium]|uniref:Threonine--tRNA ligase n=1 Tax=Candidatus Falkowbacteria bacterium CG10_big_fil_rev_8_21_14_0_10_37_18 TaxID=1974562 RepID=A0A2H0VBW4_9BACT|nr:threonine--tRNA ligase [Candidatus Falkowbacteria bacterium]NCQ12862.1 threonine--tRNA ligase [Candidatus Falkowbacteria bacterium]OIO05449.1 MAG: threonine--tRNA ligase [Candidatus Falkowbacteria bacterium CG1_02_37_21]PIR95780.1 MAG: threonine--tRNA ligase [Candidatus Falkowbacteria bacterium CG10_big_fil_rev_8_21_14_0_10_37_18]
MSQEKNNKAEISLEYKRHSLAHLLAAAVKELWPSAQLSIGPAIDNGFYYDVDFGEIKISDTNLKEIEKKMSHLAKQNLKFERTEQDIDSALKEAKATGDVYKTELISDLKIKGEKIVSFYKVGQFTDLCRGGHVTNTNQIKPGSFKLNKLAGAYWRGDEKNKMLTRIYGLAFDTKADLDDYLKMMIEAEKRDHRKIAKEQNLTMMHEYAPGIPFFLPKGMILFQELLKFARKYSYGEGYQEVKTPQLLNAELWKTSGHWDNYQEDMFILHHADDDCDLGIKPMNCPAHMLIFKRDIHSYRDLPLRLAETTTLYRNEKSGTLHGLTRVRSLSQDDSHIFVSPDQILPEIAELLKKIKTIYQVFNLQIDEIHLSTRPEKFLGEKEVWDKAENNLKTALEKAHLDYIINEGDGAFYGPKIDVKVKDAIGRQWQLATIQLDFQLPQRFDLHYSAADGSQQTPVVIHRAILGSLERFMGVIIEHYAGAFPVWLSPTQVKIVTVAEAHTPAAQKIAQAFKDADIRVEVDENNETVGNKIRKAVAEKVPYMLVIGDKEMNASILSVRDRGSDQTREISTDNLILEIIKKIEKHS